MTTRREFLKSIPHSFLAALQNFTREFPETKEGPLTARIDVVRCIAWAGSSCQLCYLSCPRREDAIRMEDQKPVIISAACDGCAMCEVACQSVNDLSAITMVTAKASD